MMFYFFIYMVLWINKLFLYIKTNLKFWRKNFFKIKLNFLNHRLMNLMFLKKEMMKWILRKFNTRKRIIKIIMIWIRSKVCKIWNQIKIKKISKRDDNRWIFFKDKCRNSKMMQTRALYKLMSSNHKIKKFTHINTKTGTRRKDPLIKIKITTLKIFHIWARKILWWNQNRNLMKNWKKLIIKYKNKIKLKWWYLYTKKLKWFLDNLKWMRW